MQRLESPKWYPVQRRNQMRLIAFPLVGVATLAGVVALTAPAANQEGAPIFVTDIPPGYRDPGLPRREGPLPRRRDHSRSALSSRAVGRKQQSLWPSPVFRTRHPDE